MEAAVCLPQMPRWKGRLLRFQTPAMYLTGDTRVWQPHPLRGATSSFGSASTWVLWVLAEVSGLPHRALGRTGLGAPQRVLFHHSRGACQLLGPLHPQEIPEHTSQARLQASHPPWPWLLFPVRCLWSRIHSRTSSRPLARDVVKTARSQ